MYINIHMYTVYTYTPLKTNIYPEKWWLEDDFPFWNGPCSGDMLYNPQGCAENIFFLICNTYPLGNYHIPYQGPFEDGFPFPRVGCVSFWEGIVFFPYL